MSALSSLPTLKASLDAHGICARKALGQHFLLDANIVRRVAACAGDMRGVTAIEIGPGPGGLTRALLETQAERVVVIEKDARFLPLLEELRAACGQLSIIHGDAMRQTLAQLPRPRKIVANLPYNVGTELLLGWLGDIASDASCYASLTLMFQKEVAARISAAPGGKEYGRLSVFAQWLCDVRYDMELPPGAFSPPPKVSSAVVTLTPRPAPLFAARRETVEKMLAHAFGQRRKMLRAALKGLHADAATLLEDAHIDPTLRAEQLSLADFGRLAARMEAVGV